MSVPTTWPGEPPALVVGCQLDSPLKRSVAGARRPDRESGTQRFDSHPNVMRDRVQLARVHRPATYQDILASRRCNCNTLKVQGSSGSIHTHTAVYRCISDADDSPSTDLRLPDSGSDLRVWGSRPIPRTGYSTFACQRSWLSACDCVGRDHPELDSPWHPRRGHMRPCRP